MHWSLYLFATFILFLIAMVIVWVVLSYNTFPNRIRSGGEYKVKGKYYQVPDLKHKRYKSKQKATKNRLIPILSFKVIDDLHDLLKSTIQLLNEANVPTWLAGGSLIGVVLWGTLLPYDDDIDFHVDWKFREYLFSREFHSLAAYYGLDAFYLRGSNLKLATKEGSCLHIRPKGKSGPTVDIFFAHEKPGGEYAVVTSWVKGKPYTYNKSEIWPTKNWIYPIKYKVYQDNTGEVKIPVPNEYEKVLDMHYGKDWKNIIQTPSPMTASHTFIFLLSSSLGVWTNAGKSKQRDRNKLVYME